MKTAVVALLVSSAAAFVPQTAQTGVVGLTKVNGYVPAGLTEEQYKKQKAAEAAKKNGNKQRFPKGKKTLDIADWLTQMEANQVLDGDKVLRSGHTYAKEKFQSKDQFDKAKGRDTGNAPAKKGGLPGFLNW